MSDAQTMHTWVAMGPAGAIGAIHRDSRGFRFRLISESWRENAYPSLTVAKNALCASLPPGSDRPEFIEH
jgi:hypothetical protein